MLPELSGNRVLHPVLKHHSGANMVWLVIMWKTLNVIRQNWLPGSAPLRGIEGMCNGPPLAIVIR